MSTTTFISQFQTSFEKIITIEDVQLIAKRVLKDNIEVLDYAIHPYAQEKIGFLSSHQRLQIVARRKSHHQDSSIILNFFMKTIPYDIPSQAEYIKERGVFQKEATFFCDIVPQLNQKYNGNFWGPQCYLVKDDVLVFQDLGYLGFKMRPKLFDETLAKSGLDALANLHVASMIAEQRLNRPLNQVFNHIFEEKIFLTHGNQYQCYLAGVNLVVKIAEEMGLNASYLPATCHQVFKAMNPSKNKRNVISHGDLWTNNLLFDDDSPPNCRLVDFQLFRYSPLAHDVAQFLYLCCSRHLRDTKLKDLLKYYYKKVLMYLKMNSKVPVSLPSWHEIIEGYKEQKLAAAVTAIMFFPIILMDGTLGAEILNNSENYAKFIFTDRSDIVMNIMKKDADYNLRLKEMTTELVEMSLILDSLPVPS